MEELEQDAPFFFKLNHLNLVVTNCKRRETFFFATVKSLMGFLIQKFYGFWVVVLVG